MDPRGWDTVAPMRILIVGAGGVGSAAAAIARRRSFFEYLLITDLDEDRAARATRIVRGEEPRTRAFPVSASTICGAGSGGTLRTGRDVARGAAATFDLTGDIVRGFGYPAPLRTPAEAARAVLRGARELDLSYFEIFLTDKAGHAQDTTWARHEIDRTERFLAELLARTRPDRELVVVTSDHGNLEDLSTRSHTRADVPVLAWGRGSEAFLAGLGPRPDLATVGAAVLAHALEAWYRDDPNEAARSPR